MRRTRPTPLDTLAPGLRAVYLHARLDVDGYIEGIYRADWDAPGFYEVLVPADLSDAHAANCALDGFHSTVPIKHLFMFEFKVWDAASGLELLRDDELDGYALAKRCIRVKLLGHLG